MSYLMYIIYINVSIYIYVYIYMCVLMCVRVCVCLWMHVCGRVGIMNNNLKTSNRSNVKI